MDPILFILVILAVGAGVGVVSAALGVGGGILMVPAFLYVFPDMDINTAKGSSLLAIMFVAAYNSWRMNRGDMKNPWNVALAISAGAIVGGFLGGWVTALMSDAAVTWIFVGLITFAAIRTFFLQSRVVHEEDVRRHRLGAAMIGLASGFVGGATGQPSYTRTHHSETVWLKSGVRFVTERVHSPSARVPRKSLK